MAVVEVDLAVALGSFEFNNFLKIYKLISFHLTVVVIDETTQQTRTIQILRITNVIKNYYIGFRTAVIA